MPRLLTAVIDGTMEATATPASWCPPVSSSAVTRSNALRGPARHARLASWRRMSGSGASTRWGTLLRATTLPSSSTASAFTDVVPTSTPTVTARPGALTNLTHVS